MSHLNRCDCIGRSSWLGNKHFINQHTHQDLGRSSHRPCLDMLSKSGLRSVSEGSVSYEHWHTICELQAMSHSRHIGHEQRFSDENMWDQSFNSACPFFFRFIACHRKAVTLYGLVDDASNVNVISLRSFASSSKTSAAFQIGIDLFISWSHVYRCRLRTRQESCYCSSVPMVAWPSERSAFWLLRFWVQLKSLGFVELSLSSSYLWIPNCSLSSLSHKLLHRTFCCCNLM